MRHLDKYISYLRNAGRPLLTTEFDDDWAPIGPTVRKQLKESGLSAEHEGWIQLAPLSNTRGEIGEPS